MIVYRGNEIPRSPTSSSSPTCRAARCSTSTPTSCRQGGQDPIRRVLIGSNGDEQDRAAGDPGEEQGPGEEAGDARRPAAGRRARANQIFLLNKGDGTIRRLVP